MIEGDWGAHATHFNGFTLLARNSTRGRDDGCVSSLDIGLIIADDRENASLFSIVLPVIILPDDSDRSPANKLRAIAKSPLKGLGFDLRGLKGIGVPTQPILMGLPC